MARSRKMKLALARKMAANMTAAESALWKRLEDGRKCRPQKLICGYIADFAYPKQRLVIEVDGSSHLRTERYDRERDAAMWVNGWRVVRFGNVEVLTDVNRVMGVIRRLLELPRLPRTKKAAREFPRVGDAVQFGCAVRRWKRLHPVVTPTARLVKN